MSLQEVQRKVDDLHHKAEIATERYNEVKAELDEAQKMLSQIQSRIQEQQAKVAEMRKGLGVFAAAQYRSGGIDQTLQLLLSDDPQEFLDQASSLNQLTERQADALRKIQLAQQALDADKLTAAQHAAELEQVRSELGKQKDEVETNLRKAQQLLNRLTAEQRERYEQAQRASRDSDRPSLSDINASGKGKIAVEYAYNQLGEPYVWAGDGPSEWDCSGLTMMAWRDAGVGLPHSSRQQYSSVARISHSQLRPGDLVFFYSPISHVGLYIGDGRMIHAPRPGKNVQVASISTMPQTGYGRPG